MDRREKKIKQFSGMWMELRVSCWVSQSEGEGQKHNDLSPIWNTKKHSKKIIIKGNGTWELLWQRDSEEVLLGAGVGWGGETMVEESWLSGGECGLEHLLYETVSWTLS